ncbi:YwqG family protein [Hymenobacter sp. H14-R3]|uniref:YwqG family protein n=1 Tax=Hymenobacter sp. H14-R3 TaxID=3046308 RepID=UPI0024BAA1F8|nr:YwqG family protein [Hymenobacter sp. H14-R3]MDJ0365789.1 YwqG family protein [Hymenobacter sp. H14-R3]
MQQLADLQALVTGKDLGEFWPLLAPLCRPSIRVLPQAAAPAAAPLALGTSRLGGAPDLPAAAAWPTWQGRSLSFIAQLNLAEVAPHDARGLLPPTGRLAFFYDALEQPWGHDPADRGRAVVQYYPAAEALVTRPLPTDLTAEAYSAFPAAALAFAPELTLPNPWDEDLPLPEEAFTEDQRAAYGFLLLTQHGDGTSRLLGNSDNLQGPMRAQCVLASQSGISIENQNLSRDQATALAQQAAGEWELLLQLDSHEAEAGMMWGDMGRLYFWIKRADLARRDFSQVRQFLQCY